MIRRANCHTPRIHLTPSTHAMLSRPLGVRAQTPFSKPIARPFPQPLAWPSLRRKHPAPPAALVDAVQLGDAVANPSVTGALAGALLAYGATRSVNRFMAFAALMGPRSSDMAAVETKLSYVTLVVNGAMITVGGTLGAALAQSAFNSLPR